MLYLYDVVCVCCKSKLISHSIETQTPSFYSTRSRESELLVSARHLQAQNKYIISIKLMPGVYLKKTGNSQIFGQITHTRSSNHHSRSDLF